MNEQEIVIEKQPEPELVIDESNFAEYFHDVRWSKPERGEVMARYCATAEFIDGRLKKDIIDLIYNKDKAEAATNVMRKLGCANEKDSIRVVREMTQDLVNGMTPAEVEQKIYKYGIEVFYYTKKEYVPVDDPHWSVITLHNLDEFLDAAGQKITMKTKIVEQDVGDKEDSIHVQEQ